MANIQVSDLSFSYEGSYDMIFEHVSFQIDTEWKLGFVGRNGRGKTTFLNLLLGKYEYSGTITSSTPFMYFPFEVRHQEWMTLDVLEEWMGMTPLWKLNRELTQLKIKEEVLYRPFETLSNGEQTKVLLAVLFLQEDSVLLIDEPTNHLDREGRAQVSAYLKGKKGFILVSHDRNFLDSCVDHMLSINKTGIEVQKGNFSVWFENKKRQEEFELAEHRRLKKEIRRLGETARRTGAWSDQAERTKIGQDPLKKESMGTRAYIGEKSRKLQSQRKNLERRREKALEETGRLLKNVETMESLKLNPLSYYKETLLYGKKVSVCYDGNIICGEIDFSVCRGDRISLQGGNGCGKTSILKLVTGEAVPFTGFFERGNGIKISYVPQDPSQLNGGLSEYARKYGIEESLFKALLRKLDFSRDQFDKPMECFSSGQKKKVLIARSLCERAHLYVWDEPLNYIDVYSRIQIEELLLAYKPTLLFVEHDQEFVRNIATKEVEFPVFSARRSAQQFHW